MPGLKIAQVEAKMPPRNGRRAVDSPDLLEAMA